jgi:hypothetical protein
MFEYIYGLLNCFQYEVLEISLHVIAILTTDCQ